MWGDDGGDSKALTFIARDQRPAFGLEVGRDDVTEAVGQDVVCFVVDVLPAVGTGLKDRQEFKSRKVSSGRSQSTPQQCQVVLRESGGGARSPFSPSRHPQLHLGPGVLLGIGTLNKDKLLGGDRQ